MKATSIINFMADFSAHWFSSAFQAAFGLAIALNFELCLPACSYFHNCQVGISEGIKV